MKVRSRTPPRPAGPVDDYQPSQESDHFNYRWRWTDQKSIYELYSPWSGETIDFEDGSNPDDLGRINRAYSLWREPGDWTVPAMTPGKESQQPNYYDSTGYDNDSHDDGTGTIGVDDGVSYFTVERVPYMSRIWGVRSFAGWVDESSAATMMAAAVRGFLARRTLRHWFRCYYRRCMDFSTGFYYFRMFADTSSSAVSVVAPDCTYAAGWEEGGVVEAGCGDDEVELSWYKPRLARIEDIFVKNLTPRPDVSSWALVAAKEPHPDHDQKITNMGFINGPFYRVAGRGKSEKCRSEEAMAVFLEANSRRTDAVMRHDMVDLETAPLGSMIVWMDGLIDVDYYITDYAFLRATVAGNAEKEGDLIHVPNRRWGRILKSMKTHPDRILTQMYGLFALAKTVVPVASDGILDYAAADALEHCVEMSHYHNADTVYSVKTFAMHALANILDTAGGRTEFLGVGKVVARDGEDRGTAVRKHLVKRFDMFCVFLRNIQLENNADPTLAGDKKKSDDDEQPLPSRRGTELTELSLKCLSLLAREEANRELMASVITEDVIRAMVVCSEEGYVVYWGCRLLYNVCYRSEAGQDVILSRSTLLKVIEVSEYNHNGDPDVLRQIVRLKLAVAPAGWRGSVEDDIERQMRQLGLGRAPVPADLSAASPKRRRTRAVRQSAKGLLGADPRLSGKSTSSSSSKSAKDEEDEEEAQARLEDKQFRNYEVVGTYAYAYGNADSAASAKEAQHFRALFLESPKYHQEKKDDAQPESHDDGASKAVGNTYKDDGHAQAQGQDAVRKDTIDDKKAAEVAAVEAHLHKLDSEDLA